MMKRMYGDVRHISVLRNEINNNDITLDDVEETAVRYSRAGWKRNKFLYQENGSKTKNGDLLSEAHYRRVSSVRPTGRGVAARNRARATQRTSSAPSTTVESSATSSTFSTTTQSTPIKLMERRNKTKGNERRDKITSGKLKRNPNTDDDNDDDPYEDVIEAAIEEIFDQFGSDNANDANKRNASDAEMLPIDMRTESTDNIEIVGAPDLSNASNKSEVAATISTTLRIYGYTKDDKTTTVAAPTNSNVTTDESALSENRTESMYLKQNITSTTQKTASDESLIQFEVDSSEIDPITSTTNEESTSQEDSINTENISGIDGIDKPDKDIKPPDDNTIGQLYQDVAQKEEPVLINSKGV